MCGMSGPDVPKPKPIKPKPSNPIPAPQVRVDEGQIHKATRSASESRRRRGARVFGNTESRGVLESSVPSLLEG